MPFVKLDCKILDSSIWVESSETRIVWITLLAMADSNGIVEATAPGISRRACVSIENTKTALEIFESPDTESKDTTDSGRRIKRVDGGYLIVNYEKYRSKDHTAYQRLKKYREGKKMITRNHRNHTVSDNGCYASVSVSECFNIFYKEYPRKTGKHNALKSFTKIGPDKELFDKIMVALKEQKKLWTDPKYTPHPATWLNGKRWEDEVQQKLAVGSGRLDEKLTEKQECEREIARQKSKIEAYKSQRADRELTKVENDTIYNMMKYLEELEKYYGEMTK